MKKLNLIYNHNIFDAPYKQKAVKGTEKKIFELLGEDIEILVTQSSFQSPNPFFGDADLIWVEHTFAMDSEQKSALASVLREGLSKRKATDEVDIVVSFRKIEEDDLYHFVV